MKSKSIEIFVTGTTEDDIELAIDGAIRLIKEGFLSGGDKNETGSYSFDVVDEGDHVEFSEFKVYEFDEHGAERVALCIDAKDKEDAKEKATSLGVDISDITQA
jgi:hypothetical protein